MAGGLMCPMDKWLSRSLLCFAVSTVIWCGIRYPEQTLVNLGIALCATYTVGSLQAKILGALAKRGRTPGQQSAHENS